MANIKVSQMTEATSFEDGDYAMIVQANQSKKISKENMMSDIPTIQSDISTINTNIGTMANLATTDKTSLVNATNEIVNGLQYIGSSFSDVSCTHDSSNILKTIEITAGKWIILGQFTYSSTNLRYYLSILKNENTESAISSYDNAGIVAGNLCAIIETSETAQIKLNLWPNTKNVTVNGYLKAIKYQ